MARGKKSDGPTYKDAEEFPRMKYPIVYNPDEGGGDASVDPVRGDIQSGMLKRTARETGRFVHLRNKPSIDD
jgi:hypothetical protein